MTHGVTLRGRHVVLEPLLPEHAATLADAIAPDDDVFSWTNTAPRGETAMRAWILDRQRARPGLENQPYLQREPASGRAMGSTSLFDIDRAAQAAEIGHTWLAAPFRRTGANTEAKRLLLAHAFETLGLQRVQIVTDLRNERSQRAIERLGATREGILRKHRRNLEGGLRDSVYYSVIADEWPHVRARLDALLSRRAS